MLSRKDTRNIHLIVFSLDLWHKGLISVWKTKMESYKNQCPQSSDLGVYGFLSQFLFHLFSSTTPTSDDIEENAECAQFLGHNLRIILLQVVPFQA